MNIYKLIIIYLQGVMLLRIIKDKRVYVRQDDTNEETNYRRLSGIELPWTLRVGLSLDIKRLS